MKVILKIGSSEFLSNDAASAAKVADLLGEMKPVETRYNSVFGDTVLLLTPEYSHQHLVEMSQPGRKMQWFADAEAMRTAEANVPQEAVPAPEVKEPAAEANVPQEAVPAPEVKEPAAF